VHKKARQKDKVYMCKPISLPVSCLLAIIFLALALALACSFFPAYGQLSDPNLTIETIFSGLEAPTAMAFLGLADILVIEKDTGKVQRVVNGELAKESLLDVDVSNQVERGMLGIAVSKNLPDNKTYVFLYYTEAEESRTGGEGEIGEEGRGEEEAVQAAEEENNNNEDGEQISSASNSEDGGEPIGNRLYRYELSEDSTKLVNPKLLLDLPYQPGPAHNGGTIAIGGLNNNNICVIIGNLEVPPLNEGTGNNLAQNVRDGEKPDGRAGIICVTQDGQLVGGKGILGDEHPLDMYYAYGIRNSFGLAFDPVTGNLWDTENGGFDEINLVEPGFNSGFSVITGSSINDENKEIFDKDNLVSFGGNGQYSDPELDLGQHIVPTAIVFLDSRALNEEYENDIFVATAAGKILHFDLDEHRRQLILEGQLADKVADSEGELEDVIFADDMGTITDLKVGPDGYLYAVIFSGDIVRITPGEADTNTDEQINSGSDRQLTFGD
jgi:aldose sugar dehydrogenase